MPGRKSSGGDSSPAHSQLLTGTVLTGIFLIAAVVVLYFLRSVVAIVLLAMLLAFLVDPIATKLSQYKIPRWISVLLVYLAFLLVAVGSLILIVPTLVDQTTQVLTDYAPLIEQASGGAIDVTGFLSGAIFDQDFNSLVASIRDAGITDFLPQLVTVIADVFGGAITGLLILILAFYLVVEEKKLLEGLESVLPKKYKVFTEDLLPKLRYKVGRWVRGQLLIMFLIFLMVYIVLSIIGVPYALVLALAAGLLEIIPFIGPTLSVVPAMIIAVPISPLSPILVMVFYFIIQQIEAEFLTPKIMQKAIGLNPVIVIIAVLVGFEVGSVLGAMLAIPFTMILAVFLRELSALQRKNK